MAYWTRQLENFDSLLKELRESRQELSGKLRFNRPFLIASDVASQFYCEKKVEMQYIHGKVETEAKNIGTEAHEKLTEDSVKVKRDELWQKIYGTKPVLALEMFLLAKYGDVLLAGKPDSVLFARGVPLVVFEYKFSRSSVAYPSYHVQAQTYGILLENMGFDASKLFYAIVVADPKTKGSRELRQNVVHTVIRNGPKEAVYSINDAKIYYNKFNREIAEKDLTWAIEFWNKSREAQPTNNQNKCSSCEYQMKCE
ncbi:MAG TPA: PD-(D/E)XK nuclease family protein [Candidatus Bathyarchaeia archaeon]|nr:PD-(D/E)XK nuclease family protein [Candidatus Bathyarchaeia archaeon]